MRLKNTGTQIRTENLYFEYDSNTNTRNYTEFEVSKRNRSRRQSQAIRIGDFKGIRTNISNANNDFEIYNVLTDPKETTNLASTLPVMQATMKDEVLRMRLANTTAARPYDNTLIPALTNTPVVVSGLNYDYFNDKYAWVPNFELLSSQNSGTVNAITLDVREQNFDFGLSFNGFIEIPESGSYTFYLNTEASAHLKIHDIHVLNDDYNALHQEKSQVLYLQAGLHPIEVFYKHNDENNFLLNIQIEGPNLTKQPIPNTYLKVELNSTLTTEETDFFNDIVVYPVPAKHQLVIKSSEIDEAHLQVYNLLGNKILEIDNYTFGSVIDTSQLSNGSYILVLRSDDLYHTSKFIKN